MAPIAGDDGLRAKSSSWPKWPEGGFCAGLLLAICLAAPAAAEPWQPAGDEAAGCAAWWPAPALHPPAGGDARTQLRLGYRHDNLQRDKKDADLESLLAQRGPRISLRHEADDWLFAVELDLPRFEAALAGGPGLARLDGSRDAWRVEAARRFPEGEHGWTVALDAFSRELSVSGRLPDVLNSAPGFRADDPVQLRGDEQGAGAAVGYAWGGKAWQVYAGRIDTGLALTAQSAADVLVLDQQLSGTVLGLAGRFPLPRPGWTGEAFALVTQQHGQGGFARGNAVLGPAKAKYAALRYGFAARPAQDGRTSYRLTHGSYDLQFDGSADLRSFTGGAFGLLTPRGHLEGEANIAVTTLLAATALPEQGSGYAWQAGVSRYSFDASALTYGSALFGSIRVSEQERRLVRRGWLAHAGLSGQWELSEHALLRAQVSQTVPVASSDPLAGAPGPFIPGVDKQDGGRTISLDCIWRF